MAENRRLRIALVLAALAIIGGIVAAVVVIGQDDEVGQLAQLPEIQAAEEATTVPESPDGATSSASQEPGDAEAGTAPEDAVGAQDGGDSPATAAAEPSALDSETQRLIQSSAETIESDRRLALLVAVEAYIRSRSPEAARALQTALEGTPDFLGYLGTVSNAYRGVAFSDMSNDVTALADRLLERYAFQSGVLRARVGFQAASATASLSSGGRMGCGRRRRDDGRPLPGRRRLAA